ncbi:MAG: hypothetical protein ACLVL7_07865 [Anaerotruncus massiliensis (ex Togo et al. 2019)]
MDLRAPIRMITSPARTSPTPAARGAALLFAPPDDESRRAAAQAAMDGIREKFGQDAIGPAGARQRHRHRRGGLEQGRMTPVSVRMP